MFLTSATEYALLLVFLIGSMLAIGLETSREGLRRLVREPRAVIRALIANFVVVPLVVLIATAWLPMEATLRSAFVLLACTPGGFTALNFSRKVEGEALLAGALMCTLALLALVVSPLLIELLLAPDAAIVVPYAKVLRFIVLLMLLPIGVGMLVFEARPAWAAKVSRPLNLVALASFLGFVLVSSGWRKQAAEAIGGAGIAAMVGFVIVTGAIGWLMAGPDRGERQVLATVTSMRNVALCGAIVHASAPQHPVLVPLIAFTFLMIPMNLLFNVVCNVQAKRAAKAA